MVSRQFHAHAIVYVRFSDGRLNLVASLYNRPATRVSTERAKRRNSRQLALRIAGEATSEHDNWQRALPLGARSGVKRNLQSTIGLQL